MTFFHACRADFQTISSPSSQVKAPNLQRGSLVPRREPQAAELTTGTCHSMLPFYSQVFAVIQTPVSNDLNLMPNVMR